jgi:hypothetical protein
MVALDCQARPERCRAILRSEQNNLLLRDSVMKFRMPPGGRAGLALLMSLGVVAAAVVEGLRGADVTAAILGAFVAVLWLPPVWARYSASSKISGPRLYLGGLAVLLSALTVAEFAGQGMPRNSGNGVFLLLVSLFVIGGLARSRDEEAWQQAVRELHESADPLAEAHESAAVEAQTGDQGDGPRVSS